MSLAATVTVCHVFLSFFSSGLPNDAPSPSSCQAPGSIPPRQFRPGVVFIKRACYRFSVIVFIQANQIVQLNAFPYPGFALAGWAINGAAPQAFLASITVIGPGIFNRRWSLRKGPFPHVAWLETDRPCCSAVAATSDPNTGPDNETQGVAALTEFPPMCYGGFDFALGSVYFITGVTP
jgi:hypothetical protein